jgi:hypothetical protein
MSDDRTFVVHLQGGSYQNTNGASRQIYLAQCRRGEELVLRGEPENPHDRHAVAVFDRQGRQLGYLPSDARDSSAVLRGEGVSANVERVIGGPRWWHSLLGVKRHYGLLIRIKKAAIDWKLFNAQRSLAERVDTLVKESIVTEKSGLARNEVILRYESALHAVVELNRSNPSAAAYRYECAPINRLTMLLIKDGRADEARRAYELWSGVVDPVGLTRTDRDALERRMSKSAAKGSTDVRGQERGK